MREPQFAIAVTAVVFTFSIVTGCGNQPKEDTVSIIDEDHFEQLASTSEDGAGNAAASVEILSSAASQAAYEQSAVTAASIPAPAIQSIVPAEAPAVQAPAAASAAAGQVQAPIDAKITSFNQKVQTALRNAGHYQGDVDGKIGPKTREAIKAFQAANGLKADGVVGPNTWEALKKHINSQAQ